MRRARPLALLGLLVALLTGGAYAEEADPSWIPVRGSAVLQSGNEALARWQAQREALARGLAVALSKWLSDRELQENLSLLEPIFFAQPGEYAATVSDPSYERHGYQLIWTAKVRYDETQIVAALHRVGLLSPRDRRPTLLVAQGTTAPVVTAWRRILERAGIHTTTDPALAIDGTVAVTVTEQRLPHPFERERTLRAHFLTGAVTMANARLTIELPLDGPWSVPLTAATEPLVERIRELWGAGYRRRYRAAEWRVEGLVFPDVASWLAFDAEIVHARHIFNDVHPLSVRWHKGRLEVSYGFFLTSHPGAPETGTPPEVKNAWAWLANAGWQVNLDEEGQRFVVSSP